MNTSQTPNASFQHRSGADEPAELYRHGSILLDGQLTSAQRKLFWTAVIVLACILGGAIAMMLG